MNDSHVGYKHMDEAAINNSQRPPHESNRAVQLCLGGMEKQALPCAPWCESKCRCCCLPYARIGFKCLDEQRRRGPIMCTYAALSFCLIWVSVVGACGLSGSAGVLKNCNW